MFKFYSDYGHGWLAVKRELLSKVNFTPSQFSYQKGQTVYLEEDCDALRFLELWKSQGFETIVKEINVKGRSRIRSYERFAVSHV